MADFNRNSLDLTSSSKPQDNETPAIMSLGNSDQNPEAENGAPATGSANGEGQGPSSPTDGGAETYTQKQVKEVLASDVCFTWTYPGR